MLKPSSCKLELFYIHKPEVNLKIMILLVECGNGNNSIPVPSFFIWLSACIQESIFFCQDFKSIMNTLDNKKTLCDIRYK